MNKLRGRIFFFFLASDFLLPSAYHTWIVGDGMAEARKKSYFLIVVHEIQSRTLGISSFS